MTKFRPCIDLHQGLVKQIVGGTLRDNSQPAENFVSEKSPAWFAECFRRDQLSGGHVIMLGPGNENAAKEALAAWPGGLQIGGGINASNARAWLDAGASHVIVTSSLFDPSGKFLPHALEEISQSCGAEKLVIDLSCRRSADGWIVAMNRWQTLTDLAVTHATLDRLAPYGLRRTAMFPVYGLAEASLAVAFPPVDRLYRYLTFDRRSLGVGSAARPVDATDPTYGRGEFIYLLGVGSTTVGDMVTYNATTYQTALLTTTNGENKGCPVAVAMAAQVLEFSAPESR
jgi:phosphoribosylformimino-5-aminoimidazole carboxamide ribonucleotide (ProFAR) isomerase